MTTTYYKISKNDYFIINTHTPKPTCKSICGELEVAGNIVDEVSQLLHVVGEENRSAGGADADHTHHLRIHRTVGILAISCLLKLLGLMLRD